jgi:serine protease
MRPTAASLANILVSIAALLIAAPLHAAESNPARHRPAAESPAAAERFIVKFKSSGSPSNPQIQANASGESAALEAMTQRVQSLASRTRVALEAMRPLGPTLHMMKVKPLVAGEPMEETLKRLRADPEVEYAVPDRRVYPHATPSDPRFGGQWYLQNAQPSAINATAAWDITKGSTNIVIAVVDTGVRYDHEDLKATSAGGKLLPGFDFISADPDSTFFTANDGNGRDSDASDPGDFVTTTEANAHSNCGDPGNSSWHGTRVSGIIGALTDNAIGVAGINWNVQILPARVIGKCGGFNSDVIAGIRWAAGLSVPGVTPTPTPAKIINVSLGGQGSCDSASADAISQVASAGVLVVVSAGNEGGPVDSPANCPGAAAIAGLRHIGSKVGFSSLGPEITVGAPGGNCVNTGPGDPCLFSIDTTTNTGTQGPVASGYTDQLNFNVGTSFSAPIVSGIAGLMVSVNSNLRSTQLIARLKEGAKPYTTTSDTVPAPPVCHVPASQADVQAEECICTTAACGAGMANALGSVNAALRPIAAITVQGTISAGAALTLQGSGSTAANGHALSSFSWVQGGNSISTGQTANITAPSSGTTTACLTVTDDAGKQDTAKVTLSTTTATVTSLAPGAATCSTSQVTVSATDAGAAEAGADPGTFTFTRTGDVSAVLNVSINMTGSAANGTDYNTIAGNVAFAAGQATTVATITPIDDTIFEGSESVIVTVQAGPGYEVGSPSSATITIADNDTANTPPAPPPAPPPTGNSSSGGGGALDWLTLLVTLGAVATAMWARKRQARRVHVVWRRAERRTAPRD